MDSSLAAPPRPRVQSLWVRLAEIPTCSFQHSHLASEWISFGESLDHVQCKICFCFNKMINGKMAPSKARHHQVFARSPTQNPKATHLRPSAQHTLAVLGHGRPCSQKHFTWGHPENCGKASDLHSSLYVSIKKYPFSFYCITFVDSIVSHCFYFSILFQQTIANLVMPWLLGRGV